MFSGMISSVGSRAAALAYCLLLLLGSAAAGQDSAADRSASDEPWYSQPATTVEGVTEYRLPNGLRVLLAPDRSASNVMVTIAYFVGSRHEGRGERGMAHLLEHMLFKGSTAFPDPAKALRDHGARNNGTTWTDRTKYWESMIATDENLEFALKFEADRMVNSFIDAGELAKEMTVVRNEFETGENSPFNLMLQGLLAQAFRWHSYGHATIGNRSDIERVPADNLRRFYKHYYRPENAMLVIAGRYKTERALELIDKYFAPLENPAEPIVATWTDEPAQDGPHYFEIHRAGAQPVVGVLYHTPAAANPEATAASFFRPLLSDIPWGRLHKELVMTELATDASVLTFEMEERGQVIAIATLKQGQDPKAALERLKEVMEGFAEEPVTQEEVDRARASLLSQRKDLTSMDQIGYMLTDYAALGDWRLWFLERDRIESMTPADVQAVAQKYFIESNRTSGMFIPTESPQRAQIPGKPDVLAMLEGYQGREPVAPGEEFDATPANIESRTVRSELAPNIALAAVQKKSRAEAVGIVMNIYFGDEQSLGDQRAAAELLGQMMRRGSQSLSWQELSDEFDKAQSHINFVSQRGLLTVYITSDRKHYARMLEITADLLRNASFPEAEFPTVVGYRISDLERALAEPQQLAENALQRALAPFPEGSFHYVPTIEQSLAEFRSLKLEDVKSFYREVFGPGSVQVGAVGDFDQAELQSALKTMFEGWSAPLPYERVPRPFAPAETSTTQIDTPDKPMAVASLAAAINVDHEDQDAVALYIANYILGVSSHSRLANRLRDQEGLSYDAYARFATSSLDPVASLRAYATCASQNLDKTAAILEEEVTRWMLTGVTEQELAEASKAHRQAYLSSFNDDAIIARTLARDLYLDRTMMWEAQRLDRIDALTVEQVNDALKRRLALGGLVRVRAGELEPD